MKLVWILRQWLKNVGIKSKLATFLTSSIFWTQLPRILAHEKDFTDFVLTRPAACRSIILSFISQLDCHSFYLHTTLPTRMCLLSVKKIKADTVRKISQWHLIISLYCPHLIYLILQGVPQNILYNSYHTVILYCQSQPQLQLS